MLRPWLPAKAAEDDRQLRLGRIMPSRSRGLQLHPAMKTLVSGGQKSTVGLPHSGYLRQFHVGAVNRSRS